MVESEDREATGRRDAPVSLPPDNAFAEASARHMSNAVFTPPLPHNEPVLAYAPGSPERAALQTEYDRRIKARIDAPMWIGGKTVETKEQRKMSPPHKHTHVLGMSHHGDAKHV